MHIVYVEAGYPHTHGGGGGAGTYVQLVGRELARLGHRVSVVAESCPRCPRIYDDQGVTIYRPRITARLHWYAAKSPLIDRVALSLRYLEYGLGVYRFLESLHAQEPLSLVEFSEGGDFWHGYLGRNRFPYVCHLHGSRYTFLRQAGKPLRSGEWLLRSLELRFIARAEHVLAPSKAIRDLVALELGHELPPSTVLPLPLDPKLLVVFDRTSVKGDEPKLVLFAARNDPMKGADGLLRAVPLVRERVPGARFVMFGYEPTPGLVIPAGVEHHSFVSRDELLNHYRQADLCVVPSLWDNSPNTVYEAMAAGRAVVASAVGGIPELIVGGETGILVPSGDHHGLADAITALLRDDKRREEMGRLGRARIVTLADLEANVRQRLELYEHIVAARHTGMLPRQRIDA